MERGAWGVEPSRGKANGTAGISEQKVTKLTKGALGADGRRPPQAR